MEPEKEVEKTTVTPTEEKETHETTEPSHDPVKEELEKVQRQGRSEAEKAAYSLKKIAERARTLGLDPKEVLGFTDTPESEDDDAPVTVGMLKRREAQTAQKTALQLAESIEDPNERELTKHYLETRVKSSGNPQEDLRFARAAVNSIKNGQVVEEVLRKADAPRHGTGSGGPGKRSEGEFKPTEEEALFMRAYGLSKEQILKAREQQQ